MNRFIIALAVLLIFAPVQIAEAKSGCCSHHGGVCGCSCCDGSPLSAKCSSANHECSGTKKNTSFKQKEIQKAIDGGYSVKFEDDPIEYNKDGMEEKLKNQMNESIQKAKDGGYIVSINGVDYGDPEALERRKNYKAKVEGFEYELPGGGTEVYFSDSGQPITREQFLQQEEDALQQIFEESTIQNDPSELHEHYEFMEKRKAEKEQRMLNDSNHRIIDSSKVGLQKYEEKVSEVKEEKPRIKSNVSKTLKSK